MKKFILLLIITINAFFVISAESNDKSLTLTGNTTVPNPNLAERNDTNGQGAIGNANNGLSYFDTASNSTSVSTASNNSHIHQSSNHDSEYNESNIVTSGAPSMRLPYNNTAPFNTEENAPSQPLTNPSPQNHKTYTPTPQQNASVATSSQQSLPSNNTKATEPCTYETLGIIATKPKRSEYAQEIVRDQSFKAWPKDHYLKPHDLARAGWFYTDRGDLVRCFYCAGGLRNWEEGDDVWVEHARWYPKCAFLRQKMGQSFIDTVQKLNKEMKNNATIPYELVIYTMRKDGSQVPCRPGKDSEPLDEVQKIFINQGFIEKDVRKAIQQINDKKEQVTLDAIHKELVARSAKKITQPGTSDENINCPVDKRNDEQKKKALEGVKKENNQLKERTFCKICIENEVNVVFLPCRHMASCLDCSYCVETCPICRDNIKGRVKVEIPY